MSRVYSALTETTHPAGPATLDAPDDGVWENVEETPFIEIGGPGGPVFSGPSATAVAVPAPKPIPEAQPEAKPELLRAYPRLAPSPAAPAYLSVRFHDVIARGAVKPAGDGPDGSLVAFHLPEHPVSGEYRTLRDEIRKQLPDATSHVLFFTASAPEAGTTTVLLNLAITLASEGKRRALVVDGNLSRPAVAGKLALKPGPGVCEVLAHHVPLTWAIQPSAVPDLDVLTAGDATDATPTAVGREFARLLGQFRHWYDWVLVDSGVWGGMPERDAACSSADAVYLVTRDTDTERPEFTALRGWVKELGGLLRGYVTTKV